MFIISCIPHLKIRIIIVPHKLLRGFNELTHVNCLELCRASHKGWSMPVVIIIPPCVFFPGTLAIILALSQIVFLKISIQHLIWRDSEKLIFYLSISLRFTWT